MAAAGGICPECGLYSRIHLLWNRDTEEWICCDCFREIHGVESVPRMPCWRCKSPIRADLMFYQRGRVVCAPCRSIMRQQELLEESDCQKTMEEFA